MILGLVEGDVADKLASVVGDAGDGILAREAGDEQGALVGSDVAAEHDRAGTLDVDVGILDIGRSTARRRCTHTLRTLAREREDGKSFVYD